MPSSFVELIFAGRKHCPRLHHLDEARGARECHDFIKGDPACICCVAGGARDVVADHPGTEIENDVMGVADNFRDTDEFTDLDVEIGFLLYLARECIGDVFAKFDSSSRDGPQALAGFSSPADHQQRAVHNDDCPHRNLRNSECRHAPRLSAVLEAGRCGRAMLGGELRRAGAAIP